MRLITPAERPHLICESTCCEDVPSMRRLFFFPPAEILHVFMLESKWSTGAWSVHLRGVDLLVIAGKAAKKFVESWHLRHSVLRIMNLETNTCFSIRAFSYCACTASNSACFSSSSAWAFCRAMLAMVNLFSWTARLALKRMQKKKKEKQWRRWYKVTWSLLHIAAWYLKNCCCNQNDRLVLILNVL